MAIDSIISLEDVSVYQRDNLILSHVSLNIHKSEFVYLVGKTGTGKSSLMKTLYADIPLREGKAEVAGFNISELKHKEVPYLRRKIGIVFQDFQLLNDRSINDNLIFVMKATGWKDSDAMRVSIARALLNDPELLLADEPTGNLDPETSHGIMQLLFDIRKTGRAVFMATHNYALLRKYPARIIKCEQGKLIEVGEGLIGIGEE